MNEEQTMLWVNVTFCFVRQEVINLGGCTIVGDDIEPFVIHIKNKILALTSV